MSRFLIIVSAFLTYTAFKAIQLWPHHAPAAVLGSAALFFVMLGGMFIYRANTSVFEKGWFRTLAWTGSLTMATWATFIALSLPVDLSGAVAAAVHAYDPEFFREIEFAVLAISAIFVLVGFFQVLAGPKVKPVTIHLPNLASAFQGFKIAHFSDLHVGPTLRKGYVDVVVERINATNPDLIIFTGDMADAHAPTIAAHLEPLRRLKSCYGSFTITGNHEYFWGAGELLAQAKELGFIPLINENKTIRIGDRKLMIAGVTDPMGEMLEGHMPDLAKAAATDAYPDLKILLAHRPDTALEAEPFGFDLQFSGHTHAGQFFPFSLLIGFFHKFSRGLYRHGGMSVYVNSGTGYWGPADRLGVSPEISLVTLS